MTRAISPLSQRGERRDKRFDELKRRIRQVARLEGELVLLEEGLFLVQARVVASPGEVVDRLRQNGVLDRAALERWVKLDAPVVQVDAPLLAAAQRDVKVLALRPALELASEHRRALARFGRVDEEWIETKRERIEQLQAASTAYALLSGGGARVRPLELWFEGVVELVRVIRGAHEAEALREAAARLHARTDERRREARGRVAALVVALETGEVPSDPELALLAERLDAARDLPGRARRRRALDALRVAVGWPSAPPALCATLSTHDAGRPETYAALVDQAGRAMIASLPVVRDPSIAQQVLHVVARLGLVFTIGDEGLPLPGPDEGDVKEMFGKLGEILELARSGITLAKAVALWKIPMRRPTRQCMARWMAEGLELDLVAEAAAKNHVENLARVPDVRAARAYATWATRLSAHYEAQGIAFSLSPELFSNLPRNEDLAVLAMCLMEHVDPNRAAGSEKATAGHTAADPIAVLDATLALFERLPAKARGILGNLRREKAGEGKRLYPELAAWFDDDPLLDRCIHIARLAGESVLLSSAIREEFEHATRVRGERSHLEKLASRSVPQQGRLDALLRADRPLAASRDRCRRRTRRRIIERTERLLPVAYRRELDETFREILLEAWGIAIPSLTPEWRDAVRFWLVVDDNQKLLGRLLREAANAPGRDVKRAFSKNEDWLATVRSKINVDAWLAPRTTRLRMKNADADVDGGAERGAVFTVALEEDPLEVLRMGIPFATCLALDGCNAAATVLNAIEMNKRVLYVRNEAGRVVARKLLAISKELRLVGYNLYVSVSGPAEIAIRSAVLEMCEAIACDVDIPLASTGEPAEIHRGFWYDDGTVPFDDDVDVSAYCTFIGLTVPAKSYHDLSQEAQGWRACEAGDAATAVALLSSWGGPANRALGSWLVDRLGLRAAERTSADDASVFVALAESLVSAGGAGGTQRAAGMARVIDIAGRLPETVAVQRLGPLLARFPPSPRIAGALAEVGVRAVKRHPRTKDGGLAHLTMSELPAMLDDVAGALDLLDTIEPAWRHVAGADRAVHETASADRAANVVEAIFARAPDPDVVVATLVSRRRSLLARRAALRVAARHVLPGGDRAMTRLAALHPELLASADGLAGLLRQAGVDRVTPAMAKRARPPSEPPFEALRDLVVTCQDLEAVLGTMLPVGRIEAWSPGPWELAWRRRRRDDVLGQRLFDRAARVPRTATRSMELLALLGDVERLGALGRVVVNGRRDTHAPPESARTSKAKLHDGPEPCRRTARSIADQVRAVQHGHIDPKLTTMPHVDAAYADMARRTLGDESVSAELRDAARDVVMQCRDSDVVDWHRLLDVAAGRCDDRTVSRILDDKTLVVKRLPPRLVVDLWQLPEARDALARSIERGRSDDWTGHVEAAEREAGARGLSVEGLLERISLALVSAKGHDRAVENLTLDQLRSVAHAIVSEAQPDDVVATYYELEDALSAATFLRAIGRQSGERAAAIREAGKKLVPTTDSRRALAAWLEATRRSGGTYATDRAI